MSEQARDGGPAFPGIGTYSSDVEGGWTYPSGMTLRAYLAAKAMQAHIQSAWTHPAPSQASYQNWRASLPPDVNPSFQDWISAMSCDQADSLLAELNVEADE